MNLLRAVDKTIAAVELVAALFLLGGMLVLTAIPIYIRATDGDSAAFAWTMPVSLYMLLTVTFVGASLGIRSRRHIQIDVVTRALSRRAKACFGVVGWLVAAVILAALFVAAVHYCKVNWAQISKIRGAKLGLIQLGMPISLGIMVFRCILAWLEDLRGVWTGDLSHLAAFEHAEAAEIAVGHAPVPPSPLPPAEAMPPPPPAPPPRPRPPAPEDLP